MRLLLPLAALLLVGLARNLPHRHRAHKRHADDEALKALQDEELKQWEDDQRMKRQLATINTGTDAEEKMRLAEEHWQKYSLNRRRGGCKGRNRPTPPGQLRRRCPPRARPPPDAAQPYANSGYPYYAGEPSLDNGAYELERAEHEAKLRQYEAERVAAEAARALYEQQYRAAEAKRAEEEERYRLALLERKIQEEEWSKNREEEERKHYELNEQRQREYDELLRRHREQQEDETARRRAPCPALRHDILDGKTYEQIFLFAHKSGCSEDETRMAIDMARRQRIEQYALRYKYPVLFYSRERGWIKINNEKERLEFEGQEADLDFERLRKQYNFVTEIEAARPHPHHAPAYTEEELERSRKLVEAEKEAAEKYNVIDKDNNEAVAYGNDEEKPEQVIDAIVLPQDEEETKEEEEPQPAPTQEELEQAEREREAKEEEKDALVQAVADELDKQIEEERAEKEKEEKALMEEEEKARIAAELEKELREAEEKEKEEKEKMEKEEAERKAKEEAEKPVEKELPDEEEAVAAVEENKEVKVEDPVPVIPDIGDEVVPEAPEKITQPKEEDGEEVVIPVEGEKEKKLPAPKADGQTLDFDPTEDVW